jgi:hypothetical protein
MPPTATTATTAAPTTVAPAVITPGRSHICLAPASVETASGTADQAMAAVRQTFTSFLTGPTLEVAALTSRLPAQARVEAKTDNCPYLLITAVKQQHKSGGGGSGLLGRVVGGAVQQGAYTAGSASGSAVGQIAGSAAAGAAQPAAYGYGNSTQAQDELTLTTRLESGDGKVLVNETDKKKADSNGEDLLTPLVEKAATAVATAVSKPAT